MNSRRVIVIDAETWARFLEWGAVHDIPGYRGRQTVAPIVRALLEPAELYDQLKEELS